MFPLLLYWPLHSKHPVQGCQIDQKPSISCKNNDLFMDIFSITV